MVDLLDRFLGILDDSDPEFGRENVHEFRGFSGINLWTRSLSESERTAVAASVEELLIRSTTADVPMKTSAIDLVPGLLSIHGYKNIEFLLTYLRALPLQASHSVQLGVIDAISARADGPEKASTGEQLAIRLTDFLARYRSVEVQCLHPWAVVGSLSAGMGRCFGADALQYLNNVLIADRLYLPHNDTAATARLLLASAESVADEAVFAPSFQAHYNRLPEANRRLLWELAELPGIPHRLLKELLQRSLRRE